MKFGKVFKRIFLVFFIGAISFTVYNQEVLMSNIRNNISLQQEELSKVQAENEKLKNKLAKDALGDVMNQVVEVKGVKLLAAKVLDVDMNGLRNLGDQLKDKMGDGVIILASTMGTDKVNLIAMVADSAMAKGAHAGNLIKELAVLVGGGGGGRPNMAQAGGKNPEGIDSVIIRAVKVLEEQII